MSAISLAFGGCFFMGHLVNQPCFIVNRIFLRPCVHNTILHQCDGWVSYFAAVVAYVADPDLSGRGSAYQPQSIIQMICGN
jgi:hypothetical protein